MISRRIALRAWRGGALLASGLLLASAEIAIAQTTADLPIGARIRLRTPAIGLASTTTAVVDALAPTPSTCETSAIDRVSALAVASRFRCRAWSSWT